MGHESQNAGVVVGIIIGIFIGLWLGSDSKKVERAIGQCEIVRDDYIASLERANEKIDLLNSNIEDAQWNTWSSYEDMGYALENLQTEDQEDDPGTTCYIADN